MPNNKKLICLQSDANENRKGLGSLVQEEVSQRREFRIMIHASGSKAPIVPALLMVLLIFIFCVACPLQTMAQPKTITAANASYESVSAAISLANRGDTVTVPAGSATWARQLVITTGINLIGNGIGSTVITSNYNRTNYAVDNTVNYLVVYRPSTPGDNDAFRLSGFTIDLDNKCWGVSVKNLSVTPITKVRIDHNRIMDGNLVGEEPWQGVLFFYQGLVFGVCDNNQFVNGYTRYMSNDGTAWTNCSFSFGTANTMYIEDNTFTSPDTMFSYGASGGTTCFRYNTIDSKGTTGSYPLMDLHGNQPSACHATMGAEIYGNVFDVGKHGAALLDQRGGKCLLFNNTLITSASNGSSYIQTREEYNDSINSPATGPTGQPQHVSESYYWNNVRSNASLIMAGVNQTVDYGGGVGLVPRENRDFYQQGASFDGTSGVGVGPLSARPLTCKIGVGYWATDQSTTNLAGMVGKNPSTPISGTLYVCKATNVWTAFYTPYTYPHPLRSESPVLPAATIAVTSPNGGENWIAGSSNNINWSSTGIVGNVKIEYSANGGSTYSSVIASTSNNGSYAWTVPNTPSATCLVRVSQASTGTPMDASNANFTIASPATSTITLSHNSLTFGASTGGTKTPDQTILINNTGQGTLNWTTDATGSPYFLQITPSQGTGNGILQVGINTTGLLKGTYYGSVKVYASGATNSPQTITVKLKVHDQGTTSAPFGTVDTPIDGSTVLGSVPVTGWVLDDIAVQSIKIYREPLTGEQGGPNGLTYIGDAIFVDGARNDIPDAYPDYPQNFRAGWGYMMLTNLLPPNRGNGTYRLHAIGLDMEGFEIDLGTKTIHCDNAHAVKPFGAIDTPSPGGTASGTHFNNFGWALTPTPNIIPINGSTITVWVDGEPLGHPFYGNYRADIASLFPGLMNSNLSAGVFTLNTTQYVNGVHTIAWGVTDSGGNAEGLGSRFFNILNTGGTQGLNGILANESAGSQSYDASMKRPVNSQRLSVRKGIETASNREILTPDNFGTILVEIKETERFEIDLGNALGLKGGLVVGGEFKPLPIGSRLNSNKGTFSWMPAAGFLGEYDLMFLKEEAGGRTSRIPVKVSIKPKFEKV
jgi:hypothetical protein